MPIIITGKFAVTKGDWLSVLPARKRGATILGTTVTYSITASDVIAADAGRLTCWIKNIGANTVYFGGSTLTIYTGFPLGPGDTMIIEDYTGIIYGMTASGTSECRVLREYGA